jgi:hypothetical protein
MTINSSLSLSTLGAGLIALASGLALVSLSGSGPDIVSRVLGPVLLALALTFAKKGGGNGVNMAVAVAAPRGEASGTAAAEAVPEPSQSRQ